MRGSSICRDQRPRAAAEEASYSLAVLSCDSGSLLEAVDNGLDRLLRHRLSAKPPDGAPLHLHALQALVFSVCERQLRRWKRYVLRFQTIKQNLMSLLGLVVANPGSRLVNVDVDGLDRDMHAFEALDPVLPALKKRKIHISS
jgi:hypothetical protein